MGLFSKPVILSFFNYIHFYNIIVKVTVARTSYEPFENGIHNLTNKAHIINLFSHFYLIIPSAGWRTHIFLVTL